MASSAISARVISRGRCTRPAAIRPDNHAQVSSFPAVVTPCGPIGRAMGFPSPARDTTGTHQRRREHWRRTCAVWNPASTDTHDTGRPAKARESE